MMQSDQMRTILYYPLLI